MSKKAEIDFSGTGLSPIGFLMEKEYYFIGY